MIIDIINNSQYSKKNITEVPGKKVSLFKDKDNNPGIKIPFYLCSYEFELTAIKLPNDVRKYRVQFTNSHSMKYQIEKLFADNINYSDDLLNFFKSKEGFETTRLRLIYF